MLNLRARKNCELCWVGNNHDGAFPTGAVGRGRNSLDLKGLPLVKFRATHSLLQAQQALASDETDFCEAVRSDDRIVACFGYRTVAYLLDFNKNTVQRISRPKGWLTQALVIDCDTSKLLDSLLSQSAKASYAGAALEQELISRSGFRGKVASPFLPRSDRGLVFTSRLYTRLVRSYGKRQEFITPRCPPSNGMVDRVIRTPKNQFVHRHRFESKLLTMQTIKDWIIFFNNR